MNVFFSMAPDTLNVIAIIGVATALLAATIALTQNDIKKVLAYSTVSQLGYMFIGVGVGGYAASVFHLMTHAFFKACLFLGAGSVIHAMHHEQDMRKMGGLKQWMPVTFATFFISVLAIAGFPPFAGFFSKDEILWLAFTSEHGNKVVWFLALCGAGMTAFYMFRQLFMTFYGECRADHHTQEHLHESPSVMTMPLVILAIGAVFAGLIGLPGVLGGSQFAEWLAPVIHAHEEAHTSHALEWGLMGVSVSVAAFGVLIAYLMYRRELLSPETFTNLAGGLPFRLFDRKWYFDEIYQVIFVNGTLLLARFMSAFDAYIVDGIVNGAATLTRFASWLNGLFDSYIIDGLVNAVANVTFWAGNKLRRLQTGNINGYLFVILIAMVFAIYVKVHYWS
jgi:NADH-quinone oxidoreductase subunit L